MIGTLPPFTDAEIIEQPKNRIGKLEGLNSQLKDIIKDQKELIKGLNYYIKDNT